MRLLEFDGMRPTLRALPSSLRTAGAFITAFATWPLDFAMALFGVGDFSASLVEPCDLCCDPTSGYLDGHPAGEMCPHAMVADCLQCLRPVDLNRFGFCRESSRHFVVNRRPKKKGVVVQLKPASKSGASPR